MLTENCNLFAHYQPQFDDRSDSELLRTDNEQSFTYESIDLQSCRMANYLCDLGVRKGDRVSVQVKKSPESLCLYLACLRAGFVYHPLNMGYQSRELHYFLSDASPAVVICDPASEGIFGAILGPDNNGQIVTLGQHGDGTLMECSHAATGTFTTVHCAGDDLAALLYSSGTTGQPKGIMLTHDNLFSNMDSLRRAWEFSDRDRLLHALPIFHVHGLFVALGCVMLSGASMRWLAGFDAETVSRYLPECSVFMGVPTYYTRLLAEPTLDRSACSNIRVFISGSAPLLSETFNDFARTTGHEILERYGMTETNMNTSNPLHGERKPGTVGPPLPGVEVRVVDSDGATLAAGQVGDLQVRGTNVFKGYWNMPDKTAADFTPDGFFNTGDKGQIDADGYVSIVGRAKDVVITGGLNVYPKEIELFIDDLPGVNESAVIGVPHADFGEAVVAIVVRGASEDINEQDLIVACREELANFKVPKGVIFVDELPRNAMSKVQKNVLREQHKSLFT